MVTPHQARVDFSIEVRDEAGRCTSGVEASVEYAPSNVNLFLGARAGDVE
jgi:hypothetical protein